MVLGRLKRSLFKYVIITVCLGLLNFIMVYVATSPYGKTTQYCDPVQEKEDCSLYKHTIRIQHELVSEMENTRKILAMSTTSLQPIVHNSSMLSLPIIYMITPTYARWTQKADLSRLCFTLMHIPNLHWIVVEDAEAKSDLVRKIISGNYSCKVSHTTHLNVRTPKYDRKGPKDPVWFKNRGVLQRNIALIWLREAASSGLLKNKLRGVVYFGDDDNTYDLKVFEEMRYTNSVSVWPVGLSGGMKFEGPICSKGKVTSWYAMWDRKRKFPIDMAGFAINLKLLLSKPNASIDHKAKRGHLEDSILQHLVSMDELEAKADNCSKVLVWHTRTAPALLKQELLLIKKGKPSNPLVEV